MKLSNFFICAGVVATCVACNNDGNQYHELTLSYPSNGRQEIYADQTKDSVRFITYDSYKVSVSADWMTSSNKTVTVPAGHYSIDTVQVTFDPNTTGKTRTGMVTITSDYQGHAISAGFIQLPYLKIQRPTMMKEVTADGYLFQQTDSSFQTLDSLRFTTYGDWTLTQETTASWCWIPEGQATSGTPGEYTVLYYMTANTSGADRNTEFTLTSKGVSTDIKVIQIRKIED